MIRTWTRSSTRHRHSRVLTQGGPEAKSPGESIALLTEIDRKMKLVDDVTGEEVSEMHARSVLVGILDPVTRQHTLHELLSHEALKKIVQEFRHQLDDRPGSSADWTI